MKGKEVCKHCGKTITSGEEFRIKGTYNVIKGTYDVLCPGCFAKEIEDETDKSFSHWCSWCLQYRLVEIEKTDNKIIVKHSKCGHKIWTVSLIGPKVKKGQLIL